jgi:hypothetical protein
MSQKSSPGSSIAIWHYGISQSLPNSHSPLIYTIRLESKCLVHSLESLLQHLTVESDIKQDFVSRTSNQATASPLVGDSLAPWAVPAESLLQREAPRGPRGRLYCGEQESNLLCRKLWSLSRNHPETSPSPKRPSSRSGRVDSSATSPATRLLFRVSAIENISPRSRAPTP